MKVEELTRYGRAMYGRQWQTNLAVDLGINDRAVRRWLGHEREVPPNIGAALHKLMAHKVKTLSAMMTELHE